MDPDWLRLMHLYFIVSVSRRTVVEPRQKVTNFIGTGKNYSKKVEAKTVIPVEGVNKTIFSI